MFVLIDTSSTIDQAEDFWESLNTDPLPVPYERPQQSDAVNAMEESKEPPTKSLDETKTPIGGDFVKISTGCGPSPPREIPSTITKEDNRKVSTGTSPPPQSISTQVNKNKHLTLFTEFNCRLSDKYRKR